MKEIKDEGKEGFRTRRIRERMDTGKEGYWKEGIQERRVHDRRYAKKERCWTEGIQERWNAGQV